MNWFGMKLLLVDFDFGLGDECECVLGIGLTFAGV